MFLGPRPADAILVAEAGSRTCRRRMRISIATPLCSPRPIFAAVRGRRTSPVSLIMTGAVPGPSIGFEVITTEQGIWVTLLPAVKPGQFF